MTIYKKGNVDVSISERSANKGNIDANFYTEDKSTSAIEINIKWNEQPLNLNNTNMQLQLDLFLSDGSIFMNEPLNILYAEKGLIQYKISDNVIKHVGTVNAKLFLKNDTQSVHIADFNFNIKDSGVTDAVAKEITVTLLDDAVRKLAQESAIDILDSGFKEELNLDVINHLNTNNELFKGAQGLQGEQGPIGPQGIKGNDGDIGPMGLTGSQGLRGLQGLQGEQGPRGEQGLVGPQGDIGLQGIQGEQGIQGPTGLTGAKGDKGEQGIQGLTGSAGAKGDKGSAGAKGDKGSTGAKGDQGIQGIQGVKGDKGDKGEQGIAGADGTNAVTPKFMGAMTKLNTKIVIPTATTLYVPWEGTVYNTSGFWSPTNPTRLTVPAGVTMVRVAANVLWSSNQIGERLLRMKQNGLYTAGLPYVLKNAEGTSATQASSGIIPVQEGDYFELEVRHGAGEDIDFRADPYTWMSIEVVELDEVTVSNFFL